MNSIGKLLDGITWKPINPAFSGESNDGVPYATHEGILDIDGLKLKCYQLNDGQRVFDADSVEEFFDSLLEP